MADFHGHQLTEAGRNLLAKILAGNKILAYTKMALGDGQLGSTPIPSLTAVISPKVTIKVDQTPVRNSVGRWNVTTVFSNKDLENPFYFREWGVFAQDPDTQQDVLVLYANSGQTADLIPVWDGSQESTLIEQQLTCSCIVDSQITVTALIDPSQVYVTEENFSAHKNDKNNPHEVDPYQIGAETPAGAQEKADAAKAAAIAASDPKGSAAAVSSGITGGTIKAASAAAADTAAKLTTKRTIALSGGATGTATGFDGSENITIEVTSLDLSKTKVINIPNDGTADLKNFTESGIYRGLGGSFVDRPVGMATSYGTLVVFNATTYIQQYYSCLGPGNTSQVFFRQKTSTWGEWIGLHTANGYLQDVMTEAEYVALPKKDPLTIYNLVG